MLGKRQLGGGLALVLTMVSCGASTGEPASPSSADPVEESSASSAEGSELAAEEAAPEAKKNRGERGSSLSPAPAAPGTSLEEVMGTHFKDAEMIRAAVIAGTPEKAVKPAYSLVHLNDEGVLPKNWSIPLQRLQEAAGRAEDAADVAQAAAATADIGRACGMCHQKFGGPRPPIGEAPESSGTVSSQMRQHAWATERLWEGLYVPSGAAWKAGAKILGDAKFPEEVLKRGGVYARGAARDFTKIAAKAPGKWSVADRAEVYAALLGTCAACHLAME